MGDERPLRGMAPPPGRGITGRLIACWALLALGLLGSLLARPALTLGQWAGLSAVTLFGVSKAVTLLRLDPTSRRRLSWGRLPGYLLWPGMRPQPFLERDPAARPGPLWRSGLVNLLAGAALLWGVPRLLPEATPFADGVAVGLVGFAFFLLFGVFDWVAALYRLCGVPVEKLWDNPPAAASLADFWGNRWNRVYSGFARDLFFYPLARAGGVTLAAAVVFLFAGLMHEWAWSALVEGGYGGPLLYFLLQGSLVRAESTRAGRRLLRTWPLGARAWTFLVVLVPVPLLLHGPYLTRYVVPSLAGIGVHGLL